MQEFATNYKPVQPGHKKAPCPCKGCEHNINKGDKVDYTDPDTEIGCKAKQHCSGVKGNKLFVPIKPVEVPRICRHQPKY